MESSILDTITNALGAARTFDLAFPVGTRTPHLPNHPPVMHRLIRRHGDLDLGDGVSAAADMITMGLHAGTHIDAIGHISNDGRLHGEVPVGIAQSEERLLCRGVDEIQPFIGRGVLFDVAHTRGVDALGAGEAVSAEDLATSAKRDGVTLRQFDAALIRTGWARSRGDRTAYVGHPGGTPGVSLDAARWLADQGVTLVGADTPTFEPMPTRGVPVHVELLFRRNIPIVESLDLESLAAARVVQFLLVLVPLQIVGGTASPVRPIAVG